MAYGFPPNRLLYRMPMSSDPRRHLDLIEFARRLAITISALGYSKAAFARSIGAKPGQLHHWLIAGNYPNIEVLIAMARVHGLNPDWMLLGRLASLPTDVAQKIQGAYKSHGRPLAGD